MQKCPMIIICKYVPVKNKNAAAMPSEYQSSLFEGDHYRGSRRLPPFNKPHSLIEQACLYFTEKADPKGCMLNRDFWAAQGCSDIVVFIANYRKHEYQKQPIRF